MKRFVSATLSVLALSTGAAARAGAAEGAPLPDFPVGQGEGRIADQLRIDVVAIYPGDVVPDSPRPGLFTRRVEPGSHSTGTGPGYLLHVDPNAREGTDFVLQGEHVVILNRAAVTEAHAVSGVDTGPGWTLNEVPAGAPAFPFLERTRDYFYYRVAQPDGWICVAEFPDGALTTYVAVRNQRGNWIQAERQIPRPVNYSGGTELWPRPEQLLLDAVRGLPDVAGAAPDSVARYLVFEGLSQSVTALMGSDLGWNGLREEPSLTGAAAGPGSAQPGGQTR